MTDDELKALVASLAIGQREVAEQQKRTDEQLARTDAQIEKMSQRIDKMSLRIDKLGKLVGNISNNNGDVAEEFFYRSLKRNPVLNNIRFNKVTRQLKNCVNDIEDEYDIVMINGDSIAIIEVKVKAHVNDLEKLIHKKVANFPVLFDMYRDYKRYAGIASLVVYDDLIVKAQELGLFLLVQQGKHIEIAQAGKALN